jgi:Bardet-Biedl syndrome 2 protein
MIPAFQFSLGHQVLQGLVTVGKYDGKHPCLTAGTTAGKVLIHNPHNRTENEQNEIMFLNINRKITSVVSGPLSPNLSHDVLMIGTQTSLMVYDVEENADLFFKEVHDGVNVIAFGNIVSVDVPVCLVGGNCSIQAFNHEGTELFWTVTGDNVSALSFCDVNDDGIPEMICGTEDFEIRVYHHEDVLKVITETDVVIRVEPVFKQRFAYALMNGTVGVYDKMTRAWRVKSKNRVNCISCFDLDNDGIPELIAGWENGKVEVRNQNNGEVMFKDYFQAPIASLVSADYRLDGRNTLMCLTTEGDVRGWLPSSTGGDQSGSTHVGETKDGEAFRDLQAKKQELTLELNSYQEQMKQFKSGGGANATMGGKDSVKGVIETDTKLNVSLKSNKNQGTVELHLMTSNYSVIRAVVIFAEHLFDGEACMLHPIPPSNNVIVQISPAKDVQTMMHIKAMAGLSSNSVQYHVFEINYMMPKFSMYHCIEAHQMTKKPDGHCTFYLPERPARIWSWLQRSFIQMEEQQKPGPDANTPIDINFLSLRTEKPLCISMTNEQGGKIIIRTDDIEVAGEIMQDFCQFLQINELESIAHFPDEMEKFKSVLMKVDEYNAVRLKLTAEMADSSNLVKALIVKAEDYRMLSDMGNLKKVFSSLQQTNSDLIAEYNKRANNHSQLLSQLKEVNMMIQKAAKLRAGTPKTRVVSSCRQAIKKNNIHELFQIIRTGHESAQ